ncbi:MAG: Na+/H+ antiporter subunit G [Campylobacterales bacterium]|nr:Na+/H+ antiporter subunit G [Campylobacterales bacterium]
MEIIISLLILIGAFFTLVGSIGLLKLPDFFMRLHGPTKATTLGVGSILIASTLYYITFKGEISLHEILITLFLFITAPVSAHLMAKAALHERKKEKLKD